MPGRQQQNYMGNISGDINENLEKKDAKLIENLQFYQERTTDEFGVIKIMKLNEKPFRYYMLYRETGLNEQKTRARLQEKLVWYSQLKQHKNIVSIDHIDLKPTMDMCIQKLNLDIYAKYYNYTLDMAVEAKLKKFLRFREADLVYILISLLSIGKAFDLMVNSQASGWFSLNNIYITPEGFVKIYPFPLHCELKSGNGIHRSIESPHKHTKSFLENEEVVLHLSRKTSDSNNSSNITIPRKPTGKDDLRDIGLLIFQLLILNRETVEVRLYCNQKISNTLNLLEKQGQVSPQLKEILIKLICNYQELKYHDLLIALTNLKEEKQISASNSIKLDEGASIIESGISEKKENLKQLSQHKNLKAGCISIISNKKKNMQRQ